MQHRMDWHGAQWCEPQLQIAPSRSTACVCRPSLVRGVAPTHWVKEQCNRRITAAQGYNPCSACQRVCAPGSLTVRAPFWCCRWPRCGAMTIRCRLSPAIGSTAIFGLFPRFGEPQAGPVPRILRSTPGVCAAFLYYEDDYSSNRGCSITVSGPAPCSSPRTSEAPRHPH